MVALAFEFQLSGFSLCPSLLWFTLSSDNIESAEEIIEKERQKISKGLWSNSIKRKNEEATQKGGGKFTARRWHWKFSSLCEIRRERKKKKDLHVASGFWKEKKHAVEGSWLTGVCSLLEPISFTQLEREPRIQKCHKDKILVVWIVGERVL